MAIAAQIGLSITSKTEYIISLFNDRLVRGIMYNNLSKKKVDQFQHKIIPFDLQTLALLYATKPID